MGRLVFAVAVVAGCVFGIVSAGEYLGCYETISVRGIWNTFTDPANTEELCNDLCRPVEFFSLQPQVCTCQYGPSVGDDDNFGVDPLTDNHCNASCPGNVNQTCGGNGVMSLYRTGYSDHRICRGFFGRSAAEIRGRRCVKDIGDFTYKTLGDSNCHIRLDITPPETIKTFTPFLVVVRFHNVKEIKLHTRDINRTRALDVKKIEIDKDRGSVPILLDSAQTASQLMLQAVPDDFEQERWLQISSMVLCQNYF